jgi:hypothetical protein
MRDKKMRDRKMRDRKKQEDYHRYVFRDGQLVGQFERMYRESKVVPWKQDQTVDAWWAEVAVRLIEIGAPYGRAIEVGCGLGYFPIMPKRRRSGCESVRDHESERKLPVSGV